MHHTLKGVFSPVVTPFNADLIPDTQRWIAHCRWLLTQRCGLAVFGTNSEANSLSVDERKTLLETAADAKLDPARMIPGTGACSIPEAVELTRCAVKLGCAGVLMLPPFYYKDVSDEGLFAFFSEVVQRVGDARLKIYLYHIPPVAQVPISLSLIERLLKSYPRTIAGIKDSSGDWNNTKTMMTQFGGFDVFVGSEVFLLQTLVAGGAGCISATANINPAAIVDLYDNWQATDAQNRQDEITDFRTAITKFPMIPALKATIGLFLKDDSWDRVRPPLTTLDSGMKADLAAMLAARGFGMPGLPDAVRR